ncbi:ubiquinone/menaquinone biosynthesis C-methyltransferase UbiE-like isoform X2 [Asterias rubens]|uniref:ubiquinone/menaquinone biosynthesis C-methyltransferase UbiE-like isoform X2 n=1 Tax=Asterias rubens TaxID=7604 RepID=UPI001455A81F|nr:ubiquinone/menaquinone biosynthesis C-methyltransferase UbiE-like isoform X2 [Asterias rubens]
MRTKEKSSQIKVMVTTSYRFENRYVKEWLGCMAAADIIKFDGKTETYWLPTNRSNIMELKAVALTAPTLYGGFFKVAECFRKDGPSGVPYNAYHKFDELMALTQGPFFRDQLVQKFIPSVPELHQQLITGLEVLDIGCGEGISTFAMARHFPKSKFYGVDLSQSALAKARDKEDEMGLTNVEFINADITQMPSDWTDKFDYLFMHFVLHDLSYPTKALREMHRVLKPGGTLSVVESNTHSNLQENLDMRDRENILIEYIYSLLNCMPTSLYPGDGAAGLGAMWGREKAKESLEQANFRVVMVTEAYKEGVHLMCKKPMTS